MNFHSFFYLFLPSVLEAFIFDSDHEKPECYELDVENCFRESFLAALHPPIRLRRHGHGPAVSSYPRNASMFDKRKSSKTFLMCYDVRRFSLCFSYPGCSEHFAATVAAVQYHMVFGKQLPIQVFLAYRGFGKQMCDQVCSPESIASCRQVMTSDEQEEEHNLLLDASDAVINIGQSREPLEQCIKFKRYLIKMMRYRSQFCGDTAKCICLEPTLQDGIQHCNLQCESLLHVETAAGAASSSLPYPLPFCLSLIFAFLFITK